MKTAWISAFLWLFAEAALAHGGGHRVENPPRPMPPPPGWVPPRPPPTPSPPPPTPYPTPPTHDPGGPNTPTPTPAPTPTPTTPARPARPTRPVTGSRGGSSTAGSWRLWWEYNREHVVGLRGRRFEGPVTPTAMGTDPAVSRRGAVRRSLRALLASPRTHAQLKSAALIALGRVGAVDDAPLFLEALEHRDEDVSSAAALGLGLLPPIEDALMRRRVREAFDRAAARRGGRTRGFAFVGAALRAREDKTLALGLTRYGAKGDNYDAATLAYACGVTRDAALLPEVMVAARKGKVGQTKLNDVGRAHAVAGLGLLDSQLSHDVLTRLLRSRRVGVETKRSAALALGRLLREAEPTSDQLRTARKVLVHAADKIRDPVGRGYCLLALGGAKEPQSIPLLKETVDHTGDTSVKAYAALALGLATPRLGEREAHGVRSFLVEELDKTHDPERASALAIACGLARATDATKELLMLVGKKSRPEELRGSAAEALGLLGQPGKRTTDALVEALRDGRADLVQGAALGLGLLGRRGVVKELLDRLESTSSGSMQGALLLALAHLGHTTAVDPLLEILNDRSKKRVTREMAAVVLGILTDPRDHDVLFELDAHFNPFATTVVTNELLRIF